VSSNRAATNRASINRRLASANWALSLPISARAAHSLDSPNEDRSDRELARRRLQRWTSQAPFESEGLFESRLKAAGLTREAFLQMLGESREALRERCVGAMHWLRDLSEAYSSAPNDCSAHVGPAATEGKSAFLVLVAPLLWLARKRLLREARAIARRWPAAPFRPESVLEMLCEDLPVRLLTMVERAVVLELNIARISGSPRATTPEEGFANFIDSLRDPSTAIGVLEQYPVLARQLTICIGDWLRGCRDFLRNLGEDWDHIVAAFPGFDAAGELQALQAGAGDSHRGGRSVMVLRFSSGLRLVYKPRSLRVDCHFQDLLAWLNEQIGSGMFRLLNVLDRGDRGWTEFIPHEGCVDDEQPKRYYWRQGAYLALLHALEATDFHFDNLVAYGEHPILVDLESMFEPRHQPYRHDGAIGLAGGIMNESVLRVGLLPRRLLLDAASGGIEVSGLGGDPDQPLPDPVRSWENAGRDDMRVVLRSVRLRGAKNQPTLRGRKLSAIDYAGEVEEGFASTYRVLLRNRRKLLSARGLVSRFRFDKVRVILRPTRMYGLLLHAAFHPDFLQDALERDRLFDRLWLDVKNTPELARVVEAELRDLDHGDIPFFTARPSSRDLWTSSGERIEDFFWETGMSRVRRRLEALSEAAMEQQSWFIRASLATLSHASHPHRSSSPMTCETDAAAAPEQFTTAAEAVAQRLEKLAFLGGDEVTWLGLQYSHRGFWSVDPLGPDLYGGLSGIALFLGYLGHVTGQPRYTTLARATARTVLQKIRKAPSDLPSVGAFGGWGGILYLLTHLASLWGDQDLVAGAKEIVDRLPSLIENDDFYDIVEGSAGCIAALAAFYRSLGYPGVPPVARACGERLVAMAQEMEAGLAWNNRQTGPLGGFSHGSAGVGWALLRHDNTFGGNRFRSTATKAFSYQHSLFSRQLGNWYDLRPADEAGIGPNDAPAVATWCHGAPGIGLALIEFLRTSGEDEAKRDLELAVNLTRAQGFGHSHCLCHGDLGNVELLLQAGTALKRPEWIGEAKRRASATLQEITTTGWHCGVALAAETPGLMNGLAGIGYGLLRIAYPDKVPAILTLEAPPLGS